MAERTKNKINTIVNILRNTYCCLLKHDRKSGSYIHIKININYICSHIRVLNNYEVTNIYIK